MSRSFAALGAALMLAGWAGGAAAASYNLVCTGMMTRTYRYHRPNDAPTPFTTTLRIDTDKGLFCQDACAKTEHLVSVAGPSIRLRGAQLSSDMTGFADSFVLDDGKMQRFTFYPTGPHGLDHEFNLEKWEGTCERAPFTGLKD